MRVRADPDPVRFARNHFIKRGRAELFSEILVLKKMIEAGMSLKLRDIDGEPGLRFFIKIRLAPSVAFRFPDAEDPLF